MAKRPEITIVDGPLAGRRFEVGQGGLRLGRSSSNDIHIPDEELSRNHCLFEAVGEDGIRVTDLASANGTILNGSALGDEPASLKEGDVLVVGRTTIRIGEQPPPAPASDAADLDLGLGTSSGDQQGSGGKRRSPLANALWIVAAGTIAAAIWLVLSTPQNAVETPPDVKPPAEPVLKEVRYERVQADGSGIFRYFLTVSENGAMTVRIDDVPKQNRHHTKSEQLTKEALDELGEILSYKKLREIDPEFAGPEPDPPALDSWDLSVVYDTQACRIRGSNTQEPEAFKTVREKLEAFSKSELGIWAIQYPREKLIELAEQALEVATAKWEDRDVNHGNLAAAIAAYKESIFYLETVNPKPECGAKALEGVKKATEELDRRYADQRFRADKALNLSQWETAREELLTILEMIPDRRDDRNRDARAKLLSAESQLKKKGDRR